MPKKSFAAAQHIYTSAYHGEMVFLLLKGRVRVYKLVAGREITLSLIDSGQMFGEAAFAARESAPREGAYAEALAPCEVAMLNRDALFRIVSRAPSVGIRAIQLLAQQLSFYEQRIADLALREVRPRLANVLLQLAEREGTRTGEGLYRIPTRFTHEQLATMIGARRVAVSRAMKELREAGAIQSKRSYVYVRDAQALRELAKPA